MCAHLDHCSMPHAADRQAGHVTNATKLCSTTENLDDKCSEDSAEKLLYLVYAKTLQDLAGVGVFSDLEGGHS